MYYLFSPALRVRSVLAGKGTLNMILVPEQYQPESWPKLQIVFRADVKIPVEYCLFLQLSYIDILDHSRYPTKDRLSAFNQGWRLLKGLSGLLKRE